MRFNAVTISILVAIVALAIWLMQFFFFMMALGSGSGGVAIIIVLLNLVGALMVAYELLYLRWSIARKFLRQFYNPDFQPNLPLFQLFLHPLVTFFKRHIIQPEPNQNVITFGRYQPFLGSGGQISQWTLAIDHKPAEEHPQTNTRIAIPVEAFYKAADQEIATLNLPYLEQFSHLLVDGFEMEVDGQILINPKTPPKTTLPEDIIWTLGHDDLRSRYRTYRLYRYTDTERDQVLSYFLRFYNIGSMTFVESSTHILPCIDRQRFSLTPLLKDSKISRLIKTLAIALLLFITTTYAFVALAYLGIFAWKVANWWLDDARRSQEAKWHEEYNYGHIRTFRESIAARNYESYYGVQDLTMYWKSIQQAVLDSMVQLLKQHGVDTSQFEQAASTIINTGIMVSGGNFSANQVAAGMGATTAMNSQPQAQTDPLKQVKVAVSQGMPASKSN
ncbi:hypothetical protein K9N68_22210 [Kovacikia minuta CCNUW1]|uniref:hypothetical protein n=1 Tax=Kovacikia minuta TaxID=2931930 RepID=UPI001CC9837D|nr:hypothetical protein [Kovacikia minuta]UBF24399.1 hypothetical protein K9N68_22210 [Kovacikia minuta CCNUW1]